MKTTLEIPDAVYRKIKARAAAQGQSVKGFVNEAVQEKLEQVNGKSGVPSSWRSLFGRASAKVVQSVQQRIDEEFSQVEPEDWR